MKKILVSLILVMSISMLTSCGVSDPGNDDGGSSYGYGGSSDNDDGSNDDSGSSDNDSGSSDNYGGSNGDGGDDGGGGGGDGDTGSNDSGNSYPAKTLENFIKFENDRWSVYNERSFYRDTNLFPGMVVLRSIDDDGDYLYHLYEWQKWNPSTMAEWGDYKDSGALRIWSQSEDSGGLDCSSWLDCTIFLGRDDVTSDIDDGALSRWGIYDRSDVVFEESSTESKDLEKIGSKVEALEVAEMEEMLVEYGMSAERSEKLGKMMTSYSKVKTKRALTSREKDVFTKELTGMSFKKASSVLVDEGYDVLIERASEINDVDPEAISELINEIL